MADPAAASWLSPSRPLRRLHQNKITDYFDILGSPSPDAKEPPVQIKPPRTTFLDLPQCLREQIYDEANIGDHKFIDLNFWTIKEGAWKDHEGQPLNEVPYYVADSSCYGDDRSPFYEESFPVGLLRVGSRLIQDEVQARLYAHNTFAVSLLGPDGLRPLESLGDSALRELRVLVVSLRPCKCLTPFCSKINWNHGECAVWPRPRSENFWIALRHLSEGTHSRPLCCVSRTDKITLARWQRICARLASNTRPRQLTLYLTAEPADSRTAHAILDPLRRLPVLQDAVINLGTHLGNIESRSLARDLALSLTNKLNYPRFRFLDLPLELQEQILQYTTLVDKYFMVWDPTERLQGWACRQHCYESSQRDSFVDPGAFCSEENPGAFNSSCECCESPLPYFLVNKAFAEVARYVFYARNEFRLFPTDSWSGQFEEIAERAVLGGDGYYELALPSFLRRMPQRHVSSLTHITLVLPPLAPNCLPYPYHQHHSWGEWVASIDSLGQSADLRRLTLEVHFSDQDPLPDPSLPTDSSTFQHWSMVARRKRDAMMEEAMLETYTRVLTPLKTLGPGLRALLVYVAWPLSRGADEDRKADERMLERMIMGEEYDSAKWGKRDRSPYSQPERDY